MGYCDLLSTLLENPVCGINVVPAFGGSFSGMLAADDLAVIGAVDVWVETMLKVLHCAMYLPLCFLSLI